MKLSVSLLNAEDKNKTTKKINNTEIDYFHIDVMDGKFVSQLSFSLKEIQEISKISRKPLDIHLMVEDPSLIIEDLKELSNINNITIHIEIDKDINKMLSKIKECGVKRGLAIKPNTDINLLKPYLDNIDIILIMTVEPGYGGQPFIESSVERIKKIKELIEDYNILLEVDGGINDKTIKKISLSDIAVVGSYITTSDNMEERINNLLV